MTQQTRYQGVLFDLDGTLVDTCTLILNSMRHAVTQVLGKDFPDEVLMAGVGTPLYDQMLRFAEGDAELAETLTATFRTFNERVHDEQIREFKGIRETLAAIERAGIPMAVVTSKRRVAAERGVRVCGLADYIGFVLAADDYPQHKPHPGPVLEGCRRLGLDPTKCLYVGDSVYDIQAGNAAGCATVAVSWGVADRTTLAAEEPTYQIDSPEELLAVVLG